MKVLAPITITSAMLTSSTLTDADSEWDAGTTYSAAVLVSYNHRVYESLQGANTNKVPGVTSSATWWLDTGPTNSWAMFDNSVSTESADTGSIVVVVTPGVIVNAVAIVAGIGDSVRVRVLDGGTVLYDQTQSLDSTPIDDWDDYFFEQQITAGELLFINLPRYLTQAVEVTIAGPSAVSAGVLAIGTAFELGGVEYGASAGISDYSRKETDDFGVTSLVQRAYARRSNQRLQVATAQIKRLQAILASLRATPCVWIGDDDTNTYAPLVVYGWCRDFQIEVAYPSLCYCTIEIEGLT